MHYITPNIPVTLYVSAPKPILPEATEENTIYLTFDDGPSASGTRKLLDILDTYGIKGTFFLLGEAAEKHPEAAKEIYNRGHDIACHTMSHVYKNIYASADTLMAEVDEWTALMEKIGVDFTKTAKLFRYPGGSTSQYLNEEKRTAMNEGLSARGFRVYDWSIVTNDALLFQCPEDLSEFQYIQQNFIETYEKAMEKPGPKILLLHENVWQTEEILPWIIEYLIKDGCTFAPLSSLDDSWTFADRANRD
jgi:peptidoglycan/xylan/chitin deacetylase (PgdA/CDA1 family)